MLQSEAAAKNRIFVGSLVRSELPSRVLDGWNEIVGRQSETICELDVTSTWEWARVLADEFLEGAVDSTVVLEDREGIAAVLPLFTKRVPIHSIPCRRLSPLTEIHAGRCGFLVRDARADYLETLMDFLVRDLTNWDVFTVTLVCGSPSERLFQEVLRHRRYRHFRVPPRASPFIELKGKWEEHLDSLDAKFRQRLRSRERRLRERGEYQFEVIEELERSKHFLDAMFEIERESWKQSAGTSVTSKDFESRVYRNLVPEAARRGWLRAHLLRLNEEPIGYLLGLLYNGVFSGLKQSYKKKFEDLYLGHLIQMFTIRGLYERNVRIYDMMGACESHKMLWTRDTYSRSTYLVYNDTANGWLAYCAGRLKRYLRPSR